VTTPFLFPLSALAACLALRRRHVAAWQVELAALVGYAAFAGACVTVGADSGWVRTTLAWYTAVCASVAAALATGLFAAIRNVRVLVIGLGAALAALGLSLAYLAGLLGEHSAGWVLLAEAGVAAIVAYLLAGRNRSACEYTACWTVLGVWASSIAGVSAAGGEQFSIWHVTLAVGVVCAFLVAGALNFDVLLWLAALAGLQWLQGIAVVVGSATNAAFAVVLAGLGLLALGLVVTRLNRRIRPAS
jgi:hypothetical protein